MTRFLHLGASLYVPATRADLAAIGNGAKYPELRSVIFCTEDAIHARELPRALENLAVALRHFEPVPLLRFVRMRNPDVLRALLDFDGVQCLTGFVLPKATRHNLDDYFAALEGDDRFEVMVTLETAEVFDPVEMSKLRDSLLREGRRHKVLSLRFGGNDLLQLLGLRRSRSRTIYATPLRNVIQQLVTTFRPHGFNLAAPVFEFLDRGDVLARETRADLTQGLFGKSAIHPDQVPVIEAQYKVSQRDLCAAGANPGRGRPARVSARRGDVRAGHAPRLGGTHPGAGQALRRPWGEPASAFAVRAHRGFGR